MFNRMPLPDKRDRVSSILCFLRSMLWKQLHIDAQRETFLTACADIMSIECTVFCFLHPILLWE